MDAETRHQLKQNELAEALSNLQNLDRGTIMTIVAVVAIIVVYAGYRGYGWWQAQAEAEAWAELMHVRINPGPGSPSPTPELETLVQGGPDSVAVMARVRLATAWLKDASQGSPEAAAKVERAIDTLQTVLNTPGAPLAAVGPARNLLARAYEEQGNWDAARAQYAALAGDDFAGTPLQMLAESRLADLDAVADEVQFAAGAAPDLSAAPTTQPAAPTEDAAQP